MRAVKFAAAALLLVAGLAGCSSNKTTAGVTVTPSTASVVLSGTQQFSAAVTGISTTTVTWELCTGSPGGNPAPVCGSASLGTINTNGLYTAPRNVPNPSAVTVVATSTTNSGNATPGTPTTLYGTATVTVDSGIRVRIIPSTYSCTGTAPTTATIATGETFAFTACVTGAQNNAVIWSVNSVVGGNTTNGTITSGGVYTAPVNAPGSVTITATSAQDHSQSGTFDLSVSAAGPPSITSIDPLTAGQGSVFQDVYIFGQNFFSTSVVLANGSPNNVTTTFIDTETLRARVFAPLLASSGTLNLSVQSECDPNCDTSPSSPLMVNPIRPGLISSTPDSISQNTTATTSVTLTGGYYSPSTLVSFNGQPRPASLINSRELNAVLSGTDFTTAGLFPLEITNPGVPAGQSDEAAINVAVTPTSGIGTSAGAPIAVGVAPLSVAIDTSTGIAVVANSGGNTVSLINVSSGIVVSTISVGNNPTGVAVDNLLHLAVVVNSGGNTFSVVNLTTHAASAPVALPAGFVPYSVGVNSLTHRALIANQSTDVATVVDISTNPATVLQQVGGSANPVSTGAEPAVGVDPEENWAVVTPGGAGTVSIVDLGQPATQGTGERVPNVVASLTLTTSIQGVAINTQTNQAFLTDPNNAVLDIFNVLDDSVQTIVYDRAEVAAAVNPLTNQGVIVNNLGNVASIFNLQTNVLIGTVALGTDPEAIAIDPTTNLAVVANKGSNNVSIFSLGPIRPFEITQSSPRVTLTSQTPQTITVVGDGFQTGALIRLDGATLTTTSTPSTCTPSCRQLQATIPASMLSTARNYVVDVQNADSTVSNIENLTVIQPVTVGNSPTAVAVDPERDLALVTNSGSNSVSIINLATGTASAPISTGSNPVGIAVLPRLALAVTANTGSNDFTVVSEITNAAVQPSPIPNCSTCNSPNGIAINPDNGIVLVTNEISNNVSEFSIAGLPSGTAPAVGAISVDQTPLAVAIDPTDDVAAVTAAPPLQFSGTNTVEIIDLSTGAIQTHLTGFEDPSAVIWDPSADQFVVTDSLNNNVVLIDPLTFIETRMRAGIDPTSLAYNFQTSTLVTINSASNTLSAVDLLHETMQVILPVQGSPQFSVDIDPRLNLAVVVDQANNRVLLVPIPR